MKRILLFFCAFLLLAACERPDPDVPVDPDPQPQPQPQPQYNQVFTLMHEASVFTVPTFNGNSVSGLIDFGEGAKQNYAPQAKWTYSSAGSHKVVIELAGATSLMMETLAGVSEIDLSGF